METYLIRCLKEHQKNLKEHPKDSEEYEFSLIQCHRIQKQIIELRLQLIMEGKP